MDEDLRPVVEYLLGLGLDQSTVAGIVRRHPPVLCYSVEDRLRPFVEFLVGEMQLPQQQVGGAAFLYMLHPYSSILVGLAQKAALCCPLWSSWWGRCRCRSRAGGRTRGGPGDGSMAYRGSAGARALLSG